MIKNDMHLYPQVDVNSKVCSSTPFALVKDKCVGKRTTSPYRIGIGQDLLNRGWVQDNVSSLTTSWVGYMTMSLL